MPATDGHRPPRRTLPAGVGDLIGPNLLAVPSGTGGSLDRRVLTKFLALAPPECKAMPGGRAGARERPRRQPLHPDVRPTVRATV